MRIPTTSSNIGSGTRKRSSGTANSSRSVTNSHRLQHLVKNNLALNLKHSPAEVWLLGPAADDLVKNNLAASPTLDSSAG